MPLSAKCTRMIHVLAGQAWKKHCGDEGIPIKDSAARNAWYRQVLLTNFRVDSCLLLKTRQFAHAMAAFEIIARNGIYWQLQADSGPIRCARVALNRLVEEYELDEPYVQATVRQMFQTKLQNLNPDQLGAVISALKIHLSRNQEPVNADDPF
jgi:hypothetical protein